MRALALLLCLLSVPALALPAAGTRGMVATGHDAASEAGVAMLRAGGNAADAAVASAFALAVVEPESSGIGGGGFALVRMKGELVFLDFREVAPAKATRDMYLKDGAPQPALSRDGALAVAVPGAVAGYLELHRRFGKLPRAKVLAPAIRLAEQGFLVDEKYRGAARFRLDVLRADPEAARVFLVNGDVPPLGHRLVQKDLAGTLRAISTEGADAFYKGAIARKLAADMRERGGILGLEDLAAYRTRTRDPLIGSFRGLAVATAPPPSAGGEVLLMALNVMETLPRETTWRDPQALHVYVETLKRAFADRALIGDPAFVDVPLAPLVAKDRAARVRAAIGWEATPSAQVPPGQGTTLAPTDAQPALDGTDTTHLSTIDADGDAVSLTTTVNYAFGAGIVAKGTGVLWNDEMDDFAIAPGVPNVYGVAGSEANAVAPGKVPLSSMTPTIVFAGPGTDAPVRMVVGSPGGPRIPTTVLQAILAHVDHGANAQQAVTLGRVHHQHLPDVVFYEPLSLDAATLGLLRLRGHRLVENAPWSNATIITIDPETGVRTGAADPRGTGSAIAE